MSRQDQLAEWASSYRLVQRLLGDVREAVGPIMVAGLAFPDPDLPGELRELAERATRVGLAAGSERLTALATQLETLRGEGDLVRRSEAAQATWEAVQRLIAWWRVFHAEAGLLAVQGHLAIGGRRDAAGPRARSRYPTIDMDLWPAGVEIDPRGRVLVFAHDLDTRRPAVLIDDVSDLDPLDPLGAPIVSRLMRARLSLRDLLGSVLEVRAHPFVERDGAIALRPAFDAAPTRHAVGPGFSPPPPPGTTEVTLRLAGDGSMSLASPEGPVPIDRTLRFNLLELVARERRRELTFSAVVAGAGDERRLLSLTTPLDGRAFAGVDPAAIRLSPQALEARARDESAGVALRAVTAWLAGRPIDPSTPAPPRTLAEAEELLRATRLGVPTPSPEALDPLIASGLAPKRDAATLARAVWLARAAGREDAHDEALRALWDGRFRGRLKAPDPDDVLIRALLALRYEPPAPDAAADEPPPALRFLLAHLEAFTGPDAARHPLPEPEQLLRLADARAWCDPAAPEPTVAALDLDRRRLWLPIARRLVAWALDPTPATHAEAAVALQLAASAGVLAHVCG